MVVRGLLVISLWFVAASASPAQTVYVAVAPPVVAPVAFTPPAVAFGPAQPAALFATRLRSGWFNLRKTWIVTPTPVVVTY